MTNESAELLRHAIIARACMDYDQALMYLAKLEEKRTEKRTFEKYEDALKKKIEPLRNASAR